MYMSHIPVVACRHVPFGFCYLFPKDTVCDTEPLVGVGHIEQDTMLALRKTHISSNSDIVSWHSEWVKQRDIGIHVIEWSAKERNSRKGLSFI